MSFNGITVVGLIEEGIYIEDIRVQVPYRVAVNIHGNLVKSSRDLAAAINQKRVFQLSGVIPPGTAFRNTGAVPTKAAAAPVVRATDDVKMRALETQIEALISENARLRKDLQAAQSQAAQSQAALDINQTLLQLTGRLDSIQGALGGLHKTSPASEGRPQAKSGVEDDVPLFIPSVKRDDAKVNINVEGSTSEADISGTKSALKALRGKKGT